MKHPHHDHPLTKLLSKRIAIIDGAMGTTIRTYGMKEADMRGERFKDAKKDLLNNGDLFSLTQPQMICDIHRRFLEAGADIIETNTFGATSITQSEFFVDDPSHTAVVFPYSSTIDDLSGDPTYQGPSLLASAKVLFKMGMPMTLGRKIDSGFARGIRESATRLGQATVVNSRVRGAE